MIGNKTKRLNTASIQAVKDYSKSIPPIRDFWLPPRCKRDFLSSGRRPWWPWSE